MTQVFTVVVLIYINNNKSEITEFISEVLEQHHDRSNIILCVRGCDGSAVWQGGQDPNARLRRQGINLKHRIYIMEKTYDTGNIKEAG